ncbi:MAG: hypothetical protein ABJF88_18415 [Rhodothermales bacterium]
MPPHAIPKNGATSFGSFEGPPTLPFIHALIRQARRWTEHVLANSKLDPAYVVEKALAALSFTLTYLARQKDWTGYPPNGHMDSNGKRDSNGWGDSSGKRDSYGHMDSNGKRDSIGENDSAASSGSIGPVVLSIPTKLVGVRAVQSNVRALRDAARNHLVQAGLELHLHATPNGVVVYWGSLAIGRIQDKHAPWLAPLLPAHVSVHLIGVTGDEAKGHTLGVNVYVRLQAGL